MINNQFQNIRDIISKINLRLVYHIRLNRFHNFKIMDNIQKLKMNSVNLIFVSLTI